VLRAKSRVTGIGILVILAIILSVSASAEIVVFEDYKTTYTMKGDTLSVVKNLRLMNVGSSPIIPGEIHFKISKDEGDSSVPPQIHNFQVINKFNKRLSNAPQLGSSKKKPANPAGSASPRCASFGSSQPVT